MADGAGNTGAAASLARTPTVTGSAVAAAGGDSASVAARMDSGGVTTDQQGSHVPSREAGNGAHTAAPALPGDGRSRDASRSSRSSSSGSSSDDMAIDSDGSEDGEVAVPGPGQTVARTTGEAGVIADMQRQLDHYFSDDNLKSDSFLRGLRGAAGGGGGVGAGGAAGAGAGAGADAGASQDRWVSIARLLQFPKLEAISARLGDAGSRLTPAQALAEAAEASELLEVSDDGASLRRIVEFDESLVVRKGRQGGGGGGGGGGNRDATIFIGNLDSRVDADMLEELCAEVGPVADVRVPTTEDGGARGFAFVEFASEASVRYAFYVLDAVQLYGRGLRVTPAGETDRIADAQGGLFVRNLHPLVDAAALDSLFALFGEVLAAGVKRDSGGGSKGFGFVSFRDRVPALMAVEVLSGRSMLLGFTLQVSLSHRMRAMMQPESSAAVLSDSDKRRVPAFETRAQQMLYAIETQLRRQVVAANPRAPSHRRAQPQPRASGAPDTAGDMHNPALSQRGGYHAVAHPPVTAQARGLLVSPIQSRKAAEHTVARKRPRPEPELDVPPSMMQSHGASTAPLQALQRRPPRGAAGASDTAAPRPVFSPLQPRPPRRGLDPRAHVPVAPDPRDVGGDWRYDGYGARQQAPPAPQPPPPPPPPGPPRRERDWHARQEMGAAYGHEGGGGAPGGRGGGPLHAQPGGYGAHTAYRDDARGYAYPNDAGPMPRHDRGVVPAAHMQRGPAHAGGLAYGVPMHAQRVLPGSGPRASGPAPMPPPLPATAPPPPAAPYQVQHHGGSGARGHAGVDAYGVDRNVGRDPYSRQYLY